jgi:small subunit ribosomal protein S26e
MFRLALDVEHVPVFATLQVKRVRCEASGVLVPKDKAVKRFIVRNIVDASAIRDIQDSSVVDGAQPLPNMPVGMLRPASCSYTSCDAAVHVVKQRGNMQACSLPGVPCRISLWMEMMAPDAY